MSAAERIAVMEGELEGIDLVEILQVVGIGRQYTGVELRKADQTPLGMLFIKAGKVVSAVAGQMRGREAFFQLFQQVGTETRKFFHVFRTETPKELPEPVGSLGNLLLEALARSKATPAPGPQKSASGVIPRPAAVRDESAPNAPAPAETVPPLVGVARPAAKPAHPPAPPSSQRRPTAAPRDVSDAAGGGPTSARAASGTPVSTRTAPNDIVARQGPASGGGTSHGDAPGGSAGSETGDTVMPRARGGGSRRAVVLGIVSPKGGSGKTTIALNLSLSLARQDRSVILVDADVNGDVLSAIAARQRAQHGAIDVLLERASCESALLRTLMPHFRILPAVGEQLPDASAFLQDHSRAWQRLLKKLSDEAEIVIVDGPAGMFGSTRQFLAGCTHVLGVLQAELIASRSFEMFKRSLDSIPKPGRPEVVGVVLNMLQSRHAASVRVLSEACGGLPKGWLLDTAIPRSDAFLDATQEGLPLRLLDDKNPPAVSWLFDTLATEISDRLGLEVAARKPKQLLI